MKKMVLIFLIVFLTLSSKCSTEPTPTPEPSTYEFAKGADISWVTEMEKEGKKFYNKNNMQTDCFSLMKELGMNSIRLRVWVNPTDGWCRKEDVLAKAKRAEALGMRLMIDFHYSDSWADPGKQNKPAAWKSMNFTELKAALYTHTKDVLNALKAEGISPEWVQIGNETSDGMLWEDGRASKNMSQYAQLTSAGYTASKSVFPDTKVIIHIDNGYDPSRYDWIFKGLKENGCYWDVIGMSLYPSASDYTKKITSLISNAKNLISTYGCEIMVCEVGMPWDQADICKSFLTSLITQVYAIPDEKGLGVFYWEPECNNGWNGYTLGAFDNSGKPTSAMDAWSEVKTNSNK